MSGPQSVTPTYSTPISSRIAAGEMPTAANIAAICMGIRTAIMQSLLVATTDVDANRKAIDNELKGNPPDPDVAELLNYMNGKNKDGATLSPAVSDADRRTKLTEFLGKMTHISSSSLAQISDFKAMLNERFASDVNDSTKAAGQCLASLNTAQQAKQTRIDDLRQKSEAMMPAITQQQNSADSFYQLSCKVFEESNQTLKSIVR